VIDQLQLQRNEVIALFNLLNRLRICEVCTVVHEKGSSIEEVINEQRPPAVQKCASKLTLKLVLFVSPQQYYIFVIIIFIQAT
jgi:hypothetical protein